MVVSVESRRGIANLGSVVKPRVSYKLKFNYTAIGHGSGIVRYIKLDDFHKNFFVTELMGVCTNMRINLVD